MKTMFGSMLVAAASAADLVEVVFLTEAGCGPCQAAIAGDVNTALKTPGIADIVDLKHHPFGNNYFKTELCGGRPYNADRRHCWAKNCVESANPADDCFVGEIVTQHGENEQIVDRMEACALTYSNPKDWMPYWDFLVCMEANYSGVLASTEKCADANGFDYQQLMKCYNGPDGDDAVVREAKATVDHPGTPTLKVNGVEINESMLLQAICTAYEGVKPKACN